MPVKIGFTVTESNDIYVRFTSPDLGDNKIGHSLPLDVFAASWEELLQDISSLSENHQLIVQQGQNTISKCLGMFSLHLPVFLF